MPHHADDASPTIELPHDLDEAVVSLRVRLGLTQAELARRLDVAVPTVQRWEKGTVPRSLPIRGRLANLLKVSAPIQELQRRAFGAAAALDRLQAALPGGEGAPGTADEQLSAALRFFDNPEFAAELEAGMRHALDLVLLPLIESLIDASEGSPLAKLPDSIVQRVKRDAVHPYAILVLGCIRQELLAAKATPAGDSGPTDTPPTDPGSEAGAAP